MTKHEWAILPFSFPGRQVVSNIYIIDRDCQLLIKRTLPQNTQMNLSGQETHMAYKAKKKKKTKANFVS